MFDEDDELLDADHIIEGRIPIEDMPEYLQGVMTPEEWWAEECERRRNEAESNRRYRQWKAKTPKATQVLLLVALVIVTVICLVAIALAASGCAAVPVVQPTNTSIPTNTWQPTTTLIPTAAPTEIHIPPTAIPPFVIVNGVDPIKILEGDGFIYSGGKETAGCRVDCTVYDNKTQGISVRVYVNGTIIFFTTPVALGNGSTQAQEILSLIYKIYGPDVLLWVDQNNAAVLAGLERDGYAGNFAVDMRLYNITTVITVTPR
jgi:hypothetical protein